MFLYSESASLLPGKQVGLPVRADPPETASMRFETSILTLLPWYDTSPFTREHSQENFSEENRFFHSPSPRTSPRYLTGTKRKIPANRISIPNITSNIQPMIFKINRSICII